MWRYKRRPPHTTPKSTVALAPLTEIYRIQDPVNDIDTTIKNIEAYLKNFKDDFNRQIFPYSIRIATMEGTFSAFDEDRCRDDDNNAAESGSTNDDWAIVVNHSEEHRRNRNTVEQFYFGYDADVEEHDLEDTQPIRERHARSRTVPLGNLNYIRRRSLSVSSGP